MIECVACNFVSKFLLIELKIVKINKVIFFFSSLLFSLCSMACTQCELLYTHRILLPLDWLTGWLVYAQDSMTFRQFVVLLFLFYSSDTPVPICVYFRIVSLCFVFFCCWLNNAFGDRQPASVCLVMRAIQSVSQF